MSRNELCACGSGKRYKHCHGRPEFVAPPSPLHQQALAAHKSGALRRAEALYRQAIEADPRDAESLHMLAMVRFERRDYGAALGMLWDAAERCAWNDAVLRQNMGLVLAKLLAPEANARQEWLVAEYEAGKRAIAQAPVMTGGVSVVLVARDAATTARAIASVRAQTHGDLELIVVDDEASWAAGANAGAGRAHGRYLAFLDAEDAFAPRRVEAMVAAMARATPLWGFSQVGHDAGNPATGSAVRPRHFLAHDLPSFTLLSHDAMERPGNLFIDRELFHALGGYPADASDPGWELSVRASRRVEPVLVREQLYVHHGRPAIRVPPGTTALSPHAARGAAQRFADALAGDAAATNPLCPQHPANRAVLLRTELRAGHADRMPVAMLRALAAEWRARAAAAPARTSPPARRGERAAVVVLGMYRSGTSAIARALNLCGAYLPERVVAARLGINPNGFWEAEAVTDLDARLLEHLGGKWNRVGFTLPSSGPLVDEFLLNAREILATEYGDAAPILIKDPRVCVLAPLWNRALQESGYRPAYVVLVRHPLETAGSIETQGDMPLAAGLDLWLDYMQRVDAFAQSCGQRVVYVRYDELLEDWRRVLRTVARGLGVPLDLEGRAGEIERFLEAGMRNHRAPDAGWAATIGGARGEAVQSLYDRLLERCAQDRAAGESG